MSNMTKLYQKLLLITLILALLIGLSACGDNSVQPSDLEVNDNTSELPYQQTVDVPDALPTKEGYIEMLEALQHAFATGELQAFIEAYPAPVSLVDLGHPGPEANEWPALLDGLTAEMSFDPEDIADIYEAPFYWRNTMTAYLYVSGGNIHLPDGAQTLRLRLGPNWQADNTPAIISMMLDTDGRQAYVVFSESPTFEEKALSIADRITWSDMSIFRTILFLGAFESEGGHPWERFSSDEIAAGASRYLGVEDFSPLDYWVTLVGEDGPDVIRGEDGEPLIAEDGHYIWPLASPVGETHFEIIHSAGYLSNLPTSVVILDTPSQGDLTVRKFSYADNFRFVVDEITDINFLVLHEDCGAPYVQLLSVQTVAIPDPEYDYKQPEEPE